MHTNHGYFSALAQKTLETMPPEDRFTPTHAEIIHAEKVFLLELTEPLVQVFYDSLYGHAATRAVFEENERGAREQTLRSWWKRTIEGPFDQDYWAWQAYVGLLHVKRKVSNTMMWSHTGLVSRHIGQLALEADKPALADAVARLMTTVGAIIGEGYQDVYLEALAEATGQSKALIDTNVQIIVQQIVKRRGE